MSNTRCGATTRAGQPCKAWAVQDTDPPLCSAHAGRNLGAGAPAGNENAAKHGFYSHTLSPQELADLVALGDDSTLLDEIAVTRVLLRRLLEYLTEAPAEDLEAIAPLVLQSTGRISRLLRDQRALSGEAADGIADAIGAALDELSTEWGIDL